MTMLQLPSGLVSCPDRKELPSAARMGTGWFSAAEMSPGGSVGVQQEADGTYTRMI